MRWRDCNQGNIWKIEQFEISQDISWNMKCIPPMTIILPDNLDTFYLGMFTHLMDWVRFFLEQYSRIDKVNQLWAMLPPYPGLA